MTGSMPPLWPALLPSEQHGDDALCAVSASGVRVRFLDGNERLCATSGLWNVNLGYGNEAVAAAGAEAMRHASYLGLFRYENGYAREAAAALVEAAGAAHYGRVLFSTSGGAANDLVMKLARLHHVLRGEPGRRIVVGLRDSYHGLTYGSFALSGQQLGQHLYGADQRFVRHVTANSVEELVTLMQREGPQVAAVVVEPVLGTGTVELTAPFVDALLRLRDDHGFLVVADEVATGFGRTGTMFASDTWPAPPDAMLLSKGLTNGASAAAALLVSRAVAEVFAQPGVVLSHAETQAGTPHSCATMLATLGEMRRIDAVARGRRAAAVLTATLADLASALPLRSELVGRGLFRTLRLFDDRGRALDQALVPRLVADVRAAGAIVHPGLHGIQLVPALVYTDDDIAELVGHLEHGIDRFARTASLAA